MVIKFKYRFENRMSNIFCLIIRITKFWYLKIFKGTFIKQYACREREDGAARVWFHAGKEERFCACTYILYIRKSSFLILNKFE